MVTCKSKVGLYVRPWNDKYYQSIVSECFPESQIVTISEFRNVGSIWTGDGIYKNENREILDFKILNDIHYRCRFLRSLPITKSFELIEKSYFYLNKLFDTNDFHVFFGALVDNYTLDILSRICSERKIPFVSLVSHFINGYSRFSIKGEMTCFKREVSDDEVKRVLSTIDKDDYSPNFEFNKKKTYSGSVKYYYKERLKQIVFTLKKIADRDPYNYHYNTLIFKGIKKKNIISKEIIKEFDLISDLTVENNAIYFPLHYTPEATVDYWADDFECARYEGSVLEIIKNSSSKVQILIKEHPAMYLKRDLNFYKQLKKYPNVNLIHPYESSNELLRLVENVYVYTGSVGLEALIRGKRVFTKTSNYYSNLSENILRKDFIAFEDIEVKLTSVNKENIIKSILEGLIPAKFINSRNIDNSESGKIIEFIKLYVSDYYNKIG